MSLRTSHLKRLLTALVLLPLLAWVIVSGPLVLGLAVGLFSAVGLWEFYSLFWSQKTPEKSLGVLLGWGLIAWQGSFPQSSALALVLVFWAGNIFFLFEYARKQDQAKVLNALVFAGGIIYIPGVLQLFVHLRAIEIFLVLLASFASDTGAYYAGCWLGKKKIWPVVSPKKTWVGSFGGLALSIALCLGIGIGLGSIAWYNWIWIGALLGVGAQLGDFFESALKRKLQIKDSGRLLPGHGGLLDRIDSVLFVLPIYCCITQFLPLFP